MKHHKVLIVLAVSSLVAVMILASVSPALAADERETGTVKWFNGNKGYGFIEGDSGNTVSVEFSAIEDSGSRFLEEGDPVDYIVEQGPEGLQATYVRRIAQ